ncbi:hypothetical protein GCM10009608_40540 [Pseudonocardia alaniniphila]
MTVRLGTVTLQHRDVVTVPAEQQCRGEAGQTGADDDDARHFRSPYIPRGSQPSRTRAPYPPSASGHGGGRWGPSRCATPQVSGGTGYSAGRTFWLTWNTLSGS